MPPANQTPMPSFMSPEQTAQYLSELRSYRTPRPGGARPLCKSQQEYPQLPTSTDQHKGRPKVQSETQFIPAAAKRWSTNSQSASRYVNTLGRQLPEDGRTDPYEIPYYERGQRWMERQEVRSLSRALQEKDLRSEARLYSAAQTEAANLIWKHQNPQAAYPNPDFDFRQHLKQGSHARSQSIGPFKELYVRKRSSIDSIDRSNGGSREVSSESNSTASTRSSAHSLSFRDRAMNSMKLPMRSSHRSKDGSGDHPGLENSTKEPQRTPFPNPYDRIYEEVEEADDSALQQIQNTHYPQLQVRARNTSYGSSGLHPATISTSKPVSLKNCPSPEKKFKNGIEVRNVDIRAATSMKLKDRSPNLPRPSMISDLPNRPIVSFEPNYHSDQSESYISAIKGAATPKKPTNVMPPATTSHSDQTFWGSGAAKAPTHSIEIPEISISSMDCVRSQEATKIKAVANEYDAGLSDGKLTSNETVRQHVWHKQDRGISQGRGNRSHWTPMTVSTRATAQCAACALAIEGKIVTAAGERFHPECFSCHQCRELLECVAFYPEPEQARIERLSLTNDQPLRIDGNRNIEIDSQDDDPGLRFYCHLDFHEKFSPRCRNCKTPIEGKVVVACGGEWHEGHFFCAECGDPFNSTTPFIEKDGYAWCVPCHRSRYSGRCAGCRKPIVDVVINALGKEWHEECFCCKKCGSRFADGHFFTPLDHAAPICVSCEAQRLKA